MVSDVVFSHKKDDWRTPPELFEKLDNEFDFHIDAAADRDNHLCDLWLGPGGMAEDALGVPWGVPTGKWEPSRVFLNPPYSQVADFVRKARAEADAGNALVVLLLPARTDTKWFHDCIWDQARHQPHTRTEVRFLKGRLKFSGSENSAPFPSMIVVFHPSVAFELPEAPWDAE